MNAKEALGVLRITRQTLTRYVRLGKIKVVRLPNGRYDYDEESVYALINGGIHRKTCIYARVSTSNQRGELDIQIDSLKRFCSARGYAVQGVYSDVASISNFGRWQAFSDLLDSVFDNKVERIVVTDKSCLSCLYFDLFESLFKKYGCEIVILHDTDSNDLDKQEILEILNLLSKRYSKYKVDKIKEILETG